MFTQSLVVAALVLAAPPAAGTGPNLEKGLEVRWTGTFTEASFRPGVRAIRTYDVDTRLFVLDTGDYGAEAVLFTRVFLKPDRKGIEPPAGIVRLELVRIDPKGKVSILPSPADPDNPVPKARPWPPVQLTGLPAHEAGMFFEFPDKPLKPGLTWAREDAGRPIVNWKVADAETFRGQPALKVVAEQKTAGYYGDRVRHTEWRKQETLTVHPANGYALRLERILEKRDPEADELSFRSVLSVEQQGKMTYPGRLYDERREEGLHAAAFTAMLDRALATGGREGPRPFEAVARRAQVYLADHGASDTVPYREAILAVRKRAESAAKGNLPPAPPPEEPTAPADPLVVGQPIPDVNAPGVTSFESAKLSALKGKPVVLAYFQPTAPSGLPVLKLADELHARKLATIVPLAIGRAKDAKNLAADLKTTVPVYDGTDVYKAHGLEATPVFVVVDADGVVRHVARGWGGETAGAVTREVERWAK
jgi:peroxiredoxin